MKDVKLFGSSNEEFYGNFNDITIDSDKDFNIVQLKDRARQNTVKVLLTHLGSHVLFDGYGSNLPTLLGRRLSDLLQPLINDTIIYALTYLKNIEESSLEIERLDTILNIDIKLSEYDPRVIQVLITAKLVNGDILDIILEGRQSV